MEPSAGRSSPSTWRGVSASSAVSAGTTTWTQRWRRHRGLRRRTGSSTRHMRSWATAGLKSLSCFLAGKDENEEKRKVEKEKLDESLNYLVGYAMLRLRGFEIEGRTLKEEWKEKKQMRKRDEVSTQNMKEDGGVNTESVFFCFER